MRTSVGTTLFLLAPALLSAEPRPSPGATFTASEGEALARAHAEAWADDARLVYLENDATVNADGSSARWAYLFYSIRDQTARAFSVEDGEVRVAENLGFDFPAPPLAEQWIDSGKALAAAETKARAELLAGQESTVRAMLLARGLLDPEKPEATTWAVVYKTPDLPALWVVVDATSGKVVRKWRG